MNQNLKTSLTDYLQSIEDELNQIKSKTDQTTDPDILQLLNTNWDLYQNIKNRTQAFIDQAC
jgi:alkyl hydroperoxide reductase subunit AhpF